MKILWFTNNAVNLKEGVVGGGWMQSLEQQLILDENIQLNIATRFNGKKLTINKKQITTYYLIPDKRNLLQKRIDLFFNQEPIKNYLEEYLKVIDEVQPDVIHVFGTEMDYGLICDLTDIPVVIHIQGILHPILYQLKKVRISFLQQLMTTTLSDYIKGSTIHNGLKTFKRRVKQEEKILKSCKYIIGRTKWDKHVSQILAPSATYFHCDEMLRDVFFKANWRANKNKALTIVSTISAPFYKGHETIVATCQILKKAGVKFIWHIIGIDEECNAYNLFYKQHTKIIGKNIQLQGSLDANQLISFLQDADVYVHPSHIENSSNSICEAMAIGMPVIALQVGGNDSMIKQDEDGILVPDNDPFFLAATILETVENKKLIFNIAKNAKERARNRHNPEAVTHQLKQIYTQIIKAHANK